MAPKVMPPASTEPTTRASRPAGLVEPDRFEMTRTTMAIGMLAITTRQSGAQVSRGARRPNHRRKTTRVNKAATV